MRSIKKEGTGSSCDKNELMERSPKALRFKSFGNERKAALDFFAYFFWR